MLTFGSLFAGIGGFDLGLERAGMKCLWQVEIDDYANRVLAKHWPDVPRFKDVTKFCRRAYDCQPENEFGEVICPRCGVEFGECDCIGTDQLIDEIGTVDVICGGFPCQDISNAGKRAGLDGNRSGLFFEICRIAGELRPRFIVLENVAALLNRGFDRVLGTLATLGYDAEWHCIPASAVGAPHQRDRVWIIAYVADAECGRVSLRRRIKTSGQNDYELQRIPCDDSQSSALEKNAVLANTQSQRQQGQRAKEQQIGFARCSETQPKGRGGSGVGSTWAVEPNVGRVAHGVSVELDIIRGVIGNEGNYQKAEPAAQELVWRILREVWSNQQLAASSPDIYRNRLCNLVPKMSRQRACQGWLLGKRIKEDQGLHDLWSNVCSTPFQEAQNMLPKLLERIGQKKCPKEVGRRTDRLRCLGNAIVPQVAELVGRRVIEINNHLCKGY